MRVQITAIGFNGADQTGTGTELVDCTVDYDRAAPALSSILDCPFSLSGSVTALDISLQLDATFCDDAPARSATHSRRSPSCSASIR